MDDINQQIIERSLSQARLSTYRRASSGHACSTLQLYTWNANVAAEFFFPLHFCEIVIRNAVSEALTTTYEEKWPWSANFLRNLPNKGKYRQRQDLENTSKTHTTTGKVVPELKFVFWQKMFTRRFDERLWRQQLHRVFPFVPDAQTVDISRENIYQLLEQVRRLRNRIAHHEPIFQRDLAADYQAIHTLIYWRCPQTASHMHQYQQVTARLDHDPRKKTVRFNGSRTPLPVKQHPCLNQRTPIKK